MVISYLNDGSVDDAVKRNKAEEKAWPYEWFADPLYQSRGSISGKLILDTGKPAAGAAVFLGEPGRTIAQGTTFTISHIIPLHLVAVLFVVRPNVFVPATNHDFGTTNS